jgi:glyceraldehyde-3-phosphate dehydrogenase/erythrose-4-phosphate dehydrogenase
MGQPTTLRSKNPLLPSLAHRARAVVAHVAVFNWALVEDASVKKIVHIVGTGTIGEPLIGLFTDFSDRLDIDEVTFNKRQALPGDRAKINHLMARGAKLAASEDVRGAFEKLGHKVSYDTNEALERATVVIDCTPFGNQHKEDIYSNLSGPKGFIAQGSEFGFGKPYARGVNDECLQPGEDRFLQVVSCNTHNITTLVKTLGNERAPNLGIERGVFVCMRRANDVTQSDSFVPAPQVGKHDDPEFGTHHARDAHSLFDTLGYDLDFFSSAVKLNTQYMHSLWFHIHLANPTSLDEVKAKFLDNQLVACTDKRHANLIFSFGRDHGYYGRILSQAVVVMPTLAVRKQREVYGFCFTPQDGNSLLSSIAATLWHIDPNPESIRKRLQPIERWVYREI